MLITLARRFQFVDSVVCYQYVIPYLYTGFLKKKLRNRRFLSLRVFDRIGWLSLVSGDVGFFSMNRFRYAVPCIANNMGSRLTQWRLHYNLSGVRSFKFVRTFHAGFRRHCANLYVIGSVSVVWCLVLFIR